MTEEQATLTIGVTKESFPGRTQSGTGSLVRSQSDQSWLQSADGIRSGRICRISE